MVEQSLAGRWDFWQLHPCVLPHPAPGSQSTWVVWQWQWLTVTDSDRQWQWSTCVVVVVVVTHSEATQAFSLITFSTSATLILEVSVYPWVMIGCPSLPSQQSTTHNETRDWHDPLQTWHDTHVTCAHFHPNNPQQTTEHERLQQPIVYNKHKRLSNTLLGSSWVQAYGRKFNFLVN